MEGQSRMVERVNFSMIYLIHCNNFCKCYNVLPPSTIKKKREREVNYSYPMIMKITSNILRYANAIVDMVLKGPYILEMYMEMFRLNYVRPIACFKIT
jgi:hypothetical protein